MTIYTESPVETLNSLLRGELSAVETYRRALQTFVGEPEQLELRRIHQEHQEAAGVLRQHILQQGGSPADSSGVWGTLAALIERTARLFGRTAALRALQQGEEQGIEDYESALDNPEMPAECLGLIDGKLLPRCREHIQALEEMIARR